MQFAAAREDAGKKGGGELHGGGNDNRRVPVFRSEAQLVFGGFALQFAVVEGAVVLQHGLFTQFAKSFTRLGCVLFDDAGERNDVNHVSHTVSFDVFLCERHGSEGFAAAGKDGERKQPLRLCGLIDGMIGNFAT